MTDVEPEELPRPPSEDSVKCKTGQELLSVAKDVYTGRIQEAIKESVKDKETPAARASEEKAAATGAKPLKYNALLEKVGFKAGFNLS